MGMQSRFLRNLVSTLIGGTLICAQTASASDLVPKFAFSLSFGSSSQPTAMTISSGFSNLPLVSTEVSGFIPLTQLTLYRDGQVSPSILGKALHASEDGGSRSWVWWVVGAAAVVAVVAVAASGSGDNEKPVVEGSSTTVCGNDSVLIGNECVAVPRG